MDSDSDKDQKDDPQDGDRTELQQVSGLEEQRIMTDRDGIGSENEDVFRLKLQLKRKDMVISTLRKRLAMKTMRLVSLSNPSSGTLDLSKLSRRTLKLKNQQLTNQFNGAKEKWRQMEKMLREENELLTNQFNGAEEAWNQTEKLLREENASLKEIILLQSGQQNPIPPNFPAGSEVFQPPANVNWNSFFTELNSLRGEVYKQWGSGPRVDKDLNETTAGVESELAKKRPRLDPGTYSEEGAQESAAQVLDGTTGNSSASVSTEPTGMNRSQMDVSNVTMEAVPVIVTAKGPSQKSNISEGGGSSDDLPGDEQPVGHTRDMKRLDGFFCSCGENFKTVGGLETHVARFNAN